MKLRKKKENKSADIPDSWKAQKKKLERPDRPYKQRYKIRVPGLRSFNRLAAGFLVAFNFVIAELTLTGPSENWILALFFLMNSYVCLKYVWTTRKKPHIEVSFKAPTKRRLF